MVYWKGVGTWLQSSCWVKIFVKNIVFDQFTKFYGLTIYNSKNISKKVPSPSAHHGATDFMGCWEIEKTEYLENGIWFFYEIKKILVTQINRFENLSFCSRGNFKGLFVMVVTVMISGEIKLFFFLFYICWVI